MAWIYLWHPSSGGEEAAATARFEAALQEQFRDLQAVNDAPVALRCDTLGGLHVGQLAFQHGITGYPAWSETGERLIVFTGVCEDALGHSPGGAIETLWPVLCGHRPGTVDLAGRFGAFAWDKERAAGCLVTGATETMTLWLVRGPDGWAIGNRVRPLLALTGRAARADRIGMAMLMAYGYLIGKRALFEGAERIESRTRIRIDAAGRLDPEEYISLGDYIAPAETLATAEAMERVEAALCRRVARQVAHSSAPFLPLSGGWDSRCIAAALHKAGCRIPAFTGGAPGSPDVRIAADVAARLGFPHYAGGSGLHRTLESDRCVERAAAWSRVSEGMENIRHAFSLSGPFLDGRVDVRQGLHGLGGGIHRHSYSTWLPSGLTERWTSDALAARVADDCPAWIGPRDEVADELNTVCRTLINGGDESGWSAATWLDLFYWQRRALCWGMDMMSVQHALWWHWTPLLDRDLILATLLWKERFRDPNALIQKVIGRMAPAVKDLPHAKQFREAKPARVLDRLLTVVPDALLPRGAIDPRRRAVRETYRRLHPIWREVLRREPGAGTDVVSRARLRATAAYNPAAELLWLAATGRLALRDLPG